jgi:hypothetical protein
MEREHMAHAVLFYGQDGSGKDELASILAQLLVCRSPSVESGADGTCQACGAFSRNTNPDVLEIRPGGPANMIRIEQFDNSQPKDGDPTPLRTFLRTGPIMSRHKVVIITDAHRMNSASANGLLKTLEEPPSFAKLILTTGSIGSIPTTILSRCLAVACSLPTKEELTRIFPDAEPSEILMGNGAPGKVRKLSSKRAAYRPLVGFASSLMRRGRGEALTTAEEFRALAEAIEKAEDSTARLGQAEALSLLATILSSDAAYPASWSQAVIEAHRRIIGNGSPTQVFDGLFSQILAGNPLLRSR